MPKIFLPMISNTNISLKDVFSNFGVRFGMAGEAYMFDSSVRLPIIQKHCSVFVPEVSGKMESIQPSPGLFDFTLLDRLIDKCWVNGIDLFAHTAYWHMQNPAWLEAALVTYTKEDGYEILRRHIEAYVRHLAEAHVAGIDVVNEAGMVGEDAGWAKYLGTESAEYAFKVARDTCDHSDVIPLFYNSFFENDLDVLFALNLLRYADGIGIQLHLETARDYTEKFNRARRIMEACKNAGKVVRFSEVTVLDPTNNQKNIANVYRDTIKLMKEYPGVVTDYVTWGVKYPAWNGRHVLFDNEGKPTEAYWVVVEELLR